MQGESALECGKLAKKPDVAAESAVSSLLWHLGSAMNIFPPLRPHSTIAVLVT